jgi:hypothetical protein
MVVSVVCCGFLIFEIGVKYQEDALVTFTSDSAVDVVDVRWFLYFYRDFDVFCFLKIPFAAVTFCPDLLSHNHVIDYNKVVIALKRGEMDIENVTHEQFVDFWFEVAWMIKGYNFRLKYMQAIALVTGDEFLVPFNVTIDISDFLTYILRLTWKWNTHDFAQVFFFNDYFSVDFAPIIGPSGYCFNFNMVDPGKLFNLEM